MTDADLDMRRFLYEARRALHDELILPEALDPGLYAKPDPDNERIALLDRHGTHLAWLPWYRLRRPDPEQLRTAAAIACSRLPIDLADQAIAAINDGAVTVHEPANDDYVSVDVHLGARTLALFAAHRRAVVPGYPQPDDED